MSIEEDADCTTSNSDIIVSSMSTQNFGDGDKTDIATRLVLGKKNKKTSTFNMIEV